MAKVWLVTPEQARKYKPGGRKHNIVTASCVWVGARGSNHYEGAVRNARTATNARLIPMKGNPHDNTAVAIEASGQVVGYVPRKFARAIYSQLGQLKLKDHGLQVPIRIEANYEKFADPFSVWACVPTTKEMNRHLPLEEVWSKFDKVWANAPDDLVSKIEADGYHLTQETGWKFWSAIQSNPSIWISREFNEENVDISVELFLKRQRLARNARVARARQNRKRAVISDNKRGLVNKEIAERHGISASTVGSILRGAGLSSNRAARKSSASALRTPAGSAESEPYSGFNSVNKKNVIERAERCILAVRLQQDGRKRSEIAAEMGVSAASVKDYLRDGKFYLDNSLNPERKNALEAFESHGSCSPDRLFQARKDGLVMAHLRQRGVSISESGTAPSSPSASGCSIESESEPDFETAGGSADSTLNYVECGTGLRLSQNYRSVSVPSPIVGLVGSDELNENLIREHADLSLAAVRLKNRGFSIDWIAKKLKITAREARECLKDGKFYLKNSTDPARRSALNSVSAGEATGAKQLSGRRLLQAKQDLIVLNYLKSRLDA